MIIFGLGLLLISAVAFCYYLFHVIKFLLARYRFRKKIESVKTNSRWADSIIDKLNADAIIVGIYKNTGEFCVMSDPLDYYNGITSPEEFIGRCDRAKAFIMPLSQAIKHAEFIDSISKSQGLPARFIAEPVPSANPRPQSKAKAE